VGRRRVAHVDGAFVEFLDLILDPAQAYHLEVDILPCEVPLALRDRERERGDAACRVGDLSVAQLDLILGGGRDGQQATQRRNGNKQMAAHRNRLLLSIVRCSAWLAPPAPWVSPRRPQRDSAPLRRSTAQR